MKCVCLEEEGSGFRTDDPPILGRLQIISRSLGLVARWNSKFPKSISVGFAELGNILGLQYVGLC